MRRSFPVRGLTLGGFNARGFSVWALTTALAVPVLAGCLDDWAIDDQVFPCREAEDCASGFQCDEELFVCVRTNSTTASVAPAATDIDGGVIDAASRD